MPKIAEIKEIDGEIWVRVGKPGEFKNGIAIWTPEEQEWQRKDSYKAGYLAAKDEEK